MQRTGTKQTVDRGSQKKKKKKKKDSFGKSLRAVKWLSHVICCPDRELLFVNILSCSNWLYSLKTILF